MPKEHDPILWERYQGYLIIQERRRALGRLAYFRTYSGWLRYSEDVRRRNEEFKVCRAKRKDRFLCKSVTKRT